MGRLPSRKPAAARREEGFTLIEVLVATLVMVIGLAGMAQLLGVSTIMHADAREVSTGTQLAQAKIDELMKMNMALAPAVQITPANPDSLGQNVAGYFDTPQAGVTRRWRVQAGPAPNTRVLTVRVVNARARAYGGRTELTTLLRQW